MCPDRPPAQTQRHTPVTASVHGTHTCLPITAKTTAKREGAAGTPHACMIQQGTASEHCSGPPQAQGLRPGVVTRQVQAQRPGSLNMGTEGPGCGEEIEGRRVSESHCQAVSWHSPGRRGSRRWVGLETSAGKGHARHRGPPRAPGGGPSRNHPSHLCQQLKAAAPLRGVSMWCSPLPCRGPSSTATTSRDSGSRSTEKESQLQCRGRRAGHPSGTQCFVLC